MISENSDLFLAIKSNMKNFPNDFYYTFVGEKEDAPRKDKKVDCQPFFRQFL